MGGFVADHIRAAGGILITCILVGGETLSGHAIFN